MCLCAREERFLPRGDGKEWFSRSFSSERSALLAARKIWRNEFPGQQCRNALFLLILVRVTSNTPATILDSAMYWHKWLHALCLKSVIVHLNKLFLSFSIRSKSTNFTSLRSDWCGYSLSISAFIPTINPNKRRGNAAGCCQMSGIR